MPDFHNYYEYNILNRNINNKAASMKSINIYYGFVPLAQLMERDEKRCLTTKTCT